MPLDLNVRPIVDEKYIIPKTVDFIRRQAAAKKPFFVYVGYSEMHPPVMVNPNFVGKSTERGGVYADLMGEMDFHVGQVLDAIKEAGIDDNTIMIFTSDNGTLNSTGSSAGGGSNGPWRGDFFNTPFEGSYRTAGMIRWPAQIPAGVVSNEMLAAVDWLPTLAGMIGASNLVPKDRPINGVDASAFMLGKSNTTGRDSYMLFGPDGEPMSVKWQMYKLVVRYCEGIDKPIVKPQLPLIFDLSSDPHEDWNLMSLKMDLTWLAAPALQTVMQYEQSLEKYPNIKVGEDFKGYPKAEEKDRKQKVA
jgi:arylsulfatase